MTGTPGHFSNLSPSSYMSHVTLADDYISSIHGLGIVNLSPSLSLQFMFYMFLIFFLILCLLVGLLNHLTV